MLPAVPVRMTRSQQTVRNLFVMRPHAQNFDDVLLGQDLINQTVLNIESPRVSRRLVGLSHSVVAV